MNSHSVQPGHHVPWNKGRLTENIIVAIYLTAFITTGMSTDPLVTGLAINRTAISADCVFASLERYVRSTPS
jgi:hypothetical protein